MAGKCWITILVVVASFSITLQSKEFDDNTPMANIVKALHEQEKADRPAQKPMSEMSDEEVVARAAEKASDTVVNIGIGALSAIERLQRKAVGAAANAIRDKDSRRNPKASEKGQLAKPSPDTDVAVSGTNETATISTIGAESATDASNAADEAGEQMIVFGLLVLIVSAVLYGIAYMRVKSGNMVVYSSWGDFVASAAWVVLLLVGIGCRYAAENSGDSLMTAGTIFIWCGGASAAWMIGGAFQNRSVIDVLFAVPARVIVAVLVLFAWSKLKESLDGIRDHRKGIVDGVLIPIGIALFVFNALVKPMIGDKRC